MKKTLNSALCASLLFLTACGDKAEVPVQDNLKPVAEAISQSTENVTVDYKVEHRASLVKALPAKTLAYLRIPHLVGYLTSPQADAIYPAMSDPSVLAQSAAIVKGIDKNLISTLNDPALEPLLRLLLEKQQSPIEVAVMAGIAGLMTPEVLVQVKLDIDNTEQLSSLLNSIVENGQGLVQIATAPNSAGEFQLSASGMSIFGYADFATKEFLLFGGPTALESTLDDYRLKSLSSHNELHTFEQGFDSAGAGLAIWADLSQLWGLASPMAPPEILSMLKAFKVQDTKFLYLGSGAKSGAGSARLHLQYKPGKSNPFTFLPSSSTLSAKTAGTVDYAATVPMISSENLEQLISIDRQFNESPSLEKSLEDVRQKMKLDFAVDFDELMGAFGPSMTVVKDQSGTWASLEIKDYSAFKGLISLSTKELGAQFKTESVSGVDIAHYTFPSVSKLAMDMSDEEVNSSDALPEALMQVIAGSNTHLYMVKEGSNMIISTLPQVLLARERHKGSRTVDDWFEKQQTATPNSVLSFTAEVDDLPEKAYHMYLSGIQSLSDIAGVEPNLIQLPLAEDLALAKSGRIGASVETGQDAVSVVLNYSQSPADFLFGGDTMMMVAVTGVLAAVAIPAYQDYTVRARVGESIAMSNQVKLGVSEFFMTNGRFPRNSEASEFRASVNGNDVWFDTDGQQIVIEFAADGSELEGVLLLLTPDVSGGGVINWSCSSEGAREAVLPAQCRY